jgi:nucleotidyltransferase substrate binding protein (TIGR01987 family)
MNHLDIEWRKSLNNFSRSLALLTLFYDKSGSLNHLEEQGLIKAFEYTYELAWNCMKDFYESQGETGIQGSRDAIQLAFKRGLIIDGDSWMQMLQDRNRTSHSYNEETADQIALNIISIYFALFVGLKNKLETLSNSN